MAFILNGIVSLHGLRQSAYGGRVNARDIRRGIERRVLVKWTRHRCRPISSVPWRQVEMTSGGGGGGGPPINAPSSVLLLTSSVLAIATIGCMFELGGGHPTYGKGITTGILVASLPGFLFFFYAAIRKGQQEAMDDP